jgi:hypothetical protein
MDASKVARNLYVGSAPQPGTKGFDVIVLCADEYQPSAGHYLSSRELAVPVQAARRVARHLQAGRTVLVTCRMGRNRSAFVAALALHLASGRSGRRCVEQVRKHRVDPMGVRALANRGFRRALEKLPSQTR